MIPKFEPSYPGPAQVAGIAPVYLGAVEWSPTVYIYMNVCRHTSMSVHLSVYLYQSCMSQCMYAFIYTCVHMLVIYKPAINIPLKCHIYANYIMCICNTVMSVYIYLISTHCNHQCDQEHCYTHRNYWHLPLHKYACDIVHVSHYTATVLHIYWAYKKKLSKLKLLSTMIFPCMYQQQICPSEATYIPYMKISSCVDIRQLFQYIYPKWTLYNQ